MALQKCPVPESPGMLETPLLGCRERRDSVRPPVAINLEKNTYSRSSISWLYRSGGAGNSTSTVTRVSVVDMNGVAVHRGPSIHGVFVNYL